MNSKVYVPVTQDGMKGWVFKLVCPGYAKSISHDRILMLKNATVNRNLGFDSVCNEQYVDIAYIHVGCPVFSVIDGTLERCPLDITTGFFSVAGEWEIQVAFFESNNIEPNWHDCNKDYGRKNATTGLWSGAMGKILSGEADYALQGFGGSYSRIQVADFSPGIFFSPLYWLTRYPLPIPPTWNLIRLFTKEQKFTNN